MRKKKENKEYLGYYINEFINISKIRNKESTYSNYLYTINSRMIVLYNTKIKNIDIKFINEYTNYLFDKGLCSKSIKDTLILLNEILKLADIHINIPMPKVIKKEISVFNEDEQIELEKYLLNSPNSVNLGIYLSLYTGIRIGELCALKWENIDLINNKITIKKTMLRIKDTNPNNRNKTKVIVDSPKSTSSIRDIPLPPFISSMLSKITNILPEYYLLTNSISYIEPRLLYKKYKQILSELNLSKYNFHTMRHTFATRCINQNFPIKIVSEILGHSSVKITLDRYVHPNYNEKVKMMNNLQKLY